MAMNIENAETERMARELAAITRQERPAGLADRLVAIGKDRAARLKAPFRTADPGDLLYDKRGLPR